MATPEDREREFLLREAQLQAKERELRLRELETKIYQDQKTQQAEINFSEPPLYRTSKHNPPQSSIQKLAKKIVKLAKFSGFVIVGIAFVQIGFFIGKWIACLLIASIIAAIGYQVFLKGDD